MEPIIDLSLVSRVVTARPKKFWEGFGAGPNNLGRGGRLGLAVKIPTHLHPCWSESRFLKNSAVTGKRKNKLRPLSPALTA